MYHFFFLQLDGRYSHCDSVDNFLFAFIFLMGHLPVSHEETNHSIKGDVRYSQEIRTLWWSSAKMHFQLNTPERNDDNNRFSIVHILGLELLIILEHHLGSSEYLSLSLRKNYTFLAASPKTLSHSNITILEHSKTWIWSSFQHEFGRPKLNTSRWRKWWRHSATETAIPNCVHGDGVQSERVRNIRDQVASYTSAWRFVTFTTESKSIINLHSVRLVCPKRDPNGTNTYTCAHQHTARSLCTLLRNCGPKCGVCGCVVVDGVYAPIRANGSTKTSTHRSIHARHA